jgi:hypothetical protein
MKEFISNTSQNLTPRDRVLLIVLIVAFTLTGTVYGAKAMYDKMNNLRQDISGLQEDLQRLKTFQQEQESLRQSVTEGEAIIQKHKNTALSAFLETSAQKLKIKEKLSSVSPKNTTKGTYFEEKNYAVNLRNLSTEELGRFLYDIETNEYPLQIQSCNIITKRSRARKDEDPPPATLNMTIEMSVIKPLEE